VGELHILQPFGGLDMLMRRQRLGVIQRGGLDLDNPGKQLGVAIEEPGATIGTELTKCRPEELKDLGSPFSIVSLVALKPAQQTTGAPELRRQSAQ